MEVSDDRLTRKDSENLTLNSRGYKLEKKLGDGSYAQVFLATYNAIDPLQVNPRTGSGDRKKVLLACKVIDTAKVPKEFARKFLPRELDILGRINHPHIIQTHSIYQWRSKYYIFMRFAESGDLLEFIMKNGMVMEGQARIWVRQMALAVQYIHYLEIVHRDLKCENILITSNSNVKLADFGFARSIVDANGKRYLSETYCGSQAYAAPEILNGAPYNPKMSDIWSLGVILYIMFNKAMPFDDSSPRGMYKQQMGRKWKFREKAENTLNEKAKNLVRSLLEPEVTKRGTLTQLLNSEWIAMDSRLLTMNREERAAFEAAQQERKKNFSSTAEAEDKPVSNRQFVHSEKGDFRIIKEANREIIKSREFLF